LGDWKSKDDKIPTTMWKKQQDKREKRSKERKMSDNVRGRKDS